MTPNDLILFCLILAASAHFISIGVLVARSYLKPPAKAANRPPITILRPATGIENHVERTLESAFFIDYPEFEIVFCVQRENDPIIPVIEAMRARHPNVPSRLLVGDDRISINPKLNNLVKGWAAAKHEWIVMTDSNVLVTPDYLDTILARWTKGVGLVCSPPVGTEPDGVGADLEAAFLNTYQARWQLTADVFGMAFAQGKTIFWRREDLDRAGGIAALAAEPAEDAAATKVVHRGGNRVRLVRNPWPQPLGYRSVQEIWKRQLRWARLRRATFAPLYALELVSGGFLPLVMAAVLIAFGPPTWPGLVMLFIAWYAAELLLASRMGWPISPRIALMMFVRDLALPALWVAGWTGNTFVWRGNAMDMKTSQLATAPMAAPSRSLADHALALRIRSARAVRSFRALGAFRAVGSRSLRESPLPRWTWKTGNKTR
ncbi:MAG TPA: glycosyltransferase [Bauldia sp.]|nr:glycosyltransferase [Bauldia sp.]